ncbi:MAG: potassium channel family protein, partial [Cyclobacteriaceae bacterium]|nr:potassium channel family protein [Cyclobacteriaceae bacterium]
SGNQFQPVTGFECTVVNDTLSYGRAFSHNIQVEVDNASQTDLMINDNTFYATEPYQRIKIRGLLNELIIENNTLQSTLDLTGLAIEKRLIISDNHLEGYIAFNDLIFPEIFNLVRWEQVSGNKIIVLEKLRSSNTALWVNLIECNPEVMVMEDKEELFAFPYHGLNQLELYNENAFEKLIYSYKSLYTIYNQRGDLESANACYSEMKDVQRRRLKYIFDTRGGFQNYFRWQLNVLLKVYTNHGTDPALAMVISVYVILFFGFVYFFFPSEWDVASKGKLIQDFREFSQKNDKGYLKPFITVLFGFGVSMVNALTLSLNSFVTLGFGNIPTKGFARYVCVIEGFIGWFLLSIFTVALINQVLA